MDIRRRRRRRKVAVIDLTATPKVNKFLLVDNNLTRLAVLLKFGGFYLDTDVISLKPAPQDIENFIVAEYDYVNGAVMGFRRGHHILNQTLLQLSNNFNGEIWGHQVSIDYLPWRTFY